MVRKYTVYSGRSIVLEVHMSTLKVLLLPLSVVFVLLFGEKLPAVISIAPFQVSTCFICYNKAIAIEQH